jgi:hypothetical protein
MRLSKNSKMLMSFFTKNKYINHIEQTKRTNNIIIHLYDDILNAHNYLLDIKQKRGDKFYNITTKKNHSSLQITKPKNFNSNSFPQEIRNHIDELAITEICYQFSLFNRKIKLYFITEEDHIELKIDVYNKHVDAIIMWLYIINEYASKECASNLVVYFYFTSLENWQKIIETINPILECKGWLSERFDCDKRAFLVTALTALLFEINTVRPIYCDVYRVSDGKFAYAHYANVFVTDDGQAILWDADEFGLTTKITSPTCVINNKKYILRAVK